MKRLTMLISAFLLASCAQTPSTPPAPKLKDGEVALPADYKNWSVFLNEVQRPDVKQVRTAYINNVGAKTKQGDNFPNGTVMVMDIYKAKVDADGKVITGADGKLVKGDLAKVFVMGKGEGWGELAPEGLKNGDWSYSAYLPDGKSAPDPTTACRTCHLPLASKDFVARYDEYFQKR